MEMLQGSMDRIERKKFPGTLINTAIFSSVIISKAKENLLDRGFDVAIDN